MAIIDLHHV